MNLISIFFLIVIVIQSVILLYYIGFHPDARECIRLEEVRRLKYENDQLLDQIQSLNQKNYKMSGQLYSKEN